MAADIALVARDVKRDEVFKMLPQAERLLVGSDYIRAREVLLEILRIDGQHTGAKRLLSEVQRQLTQRQREGTIQQLRTRAEDARREKQFDRAIEYLEDALKLDLQTMKYPASWNPYVSRRAPGSNQKSIYKQATPRGKSETSRMRKQIVKKALELDKQNSKVIPAYKVIEKEVEEAKRKVRARRLRHRVCSPGMPPTISKQIGLLREADGLDSTNLELQAAIRPGCSEFGTGAAAKNCG